MNLLETEAHCNHEQSIRDHCIAETRSNTLSHSHILETSS